MSIVCKLKKFLGIKCSACCTSNEEVVPEPTKLVQIEVAPKKEKKVAKKKAPAKKAVAKKSPAKKKAAVSKTPEVSVK